ncbi:unnamed protein product, partial [Didymodactylos carnosus]
RVDNQRQKQERELDDRRYQLEQDQTHELHLQDVFKTYIQDITIVLFKVKQSFVDNHTKLAYIRSNTLLTLDELDASRKLRVFTFLYESDLLPRILSSYGSSDADISLDLSGADLASIFLLSSSYKKFEFHKLSLSSVNLVNASFILCHFRNGVYFTSSALINTSFTRSNFECRSLYDDDSYSVNEPHVFFDHSTLHAADFGGSYLREVSFNFANMSNVNFNGAKFEESIQFEGTTLTNVDFRPSDLRYPLYTTFFNTDLRGALFNIYLLEQIDRGNLKMNNAILWNGTWSMNK